MVVLNELRALNFWCSLYTLSRVEILWTHYLYSCISDYIITELYIPPLWFISLSSFVCPSEFDSIYSFDIFCIIVLIWLWSKSVTFHSNISIYLHSCKSNNNSMMWWLLLHTVWCNQMGTGICGDASLTALIRHVGTKTTF